MTLHTLQNLDTKRYTYNEYYIVCKHFLVFFSALETARQCVSLSKQLRAGLMNTEKNGYKLWIEFPTFVHSTSLYVFRCTLCVRGGHVAIFQE